MSKPLDFRPTIPFNRAAALRAARLGAKLLVISGGRPGVGATTLAVKLAEVLASEALRVVLADADLYRADVASHCDIQGGPTIGDVLQGRKSIHEALQLGQAGLQILTGAASVELQASATERAIQRLIRQLPTLGRHVDWLIVDAGNQPTELAAQLWSVAEILLLVTSPEAVAVMDTYALIKTLLSRYAARRQVSLVVNQSPDAATSADVHRRIDQSCQRFLGLSIDFAGGLPPGDFRPEAGGNPGAAPFETALSRLIERLGQTSELAAPPLRAAA
jgi:flagellar biosynthesis protein FlhG